MEVSKLKLGRSALEEQVPPLMNCVEQIKIRYEIL